MHFGPVVDKTIMNHHTLDLASATMTWNYLELVDSLPLWQVQEPPSCKGIWGTNAT